MTWTIKRIEALRWRLLVRYEYVVCPAYNAAVDRVHEMGGAFYEYKDAPGTSLLKLVPVRGSRGRKKTVRREIPRVRKSLPALSQLASVASPSEEEFEVGSQFIRMKAWRDTYSRRIHAVSERLLNTIFRESIVTQLQTPRVLKINGRYYPVRWGSIGYQDRIRFWWPSPKRESSLLVLE